MILRCVREEEGRLEKGGKTNEGAQKRGGGMRRRFSSPYRMPCTASSSPSSHKSNTAHSSGSASPLEPSSPERRRGVVEDRAESERGATRPCVGRGCSSCCPVRAGRVGQAGARAARPEDRPGACASPRMVRAGIGAGEGGVVRSPRQDGESRTTREKRVLIIALLPAARTLSSLHPRRAHARTHQSHTHHAPTLAPHDKGAILHKNGTGQATFLHTHTHTPQKHLFSFLPIQLCFPGGQRHAPRRLGRLILGHALVQVPLFA